MAKSAIGTLEARFWNRNGVYKYIDTIICCSEFMKSKMDSNPVFADRKLKEMVGHTPIEVLSGAILGVVMGFIIPLM